MMQFAAFNAYCPFEIGDKVKDNRGRVLTITDIASVYYLKKQTVEFIYEFDNSGKYQAIKTEVNIHSPSFQEGGDRC
jgi:hypothetical protein